MSQAYHAANQRLVKLLYWGQGRRNREEWRSKIGDTGGIGRQCSLQKAGNILAESPMYRAYLSEEKFEMFLHIMHAAKRVKHSK